MLNEATDDGMEEVVVGMAHRGRLNVLANIIGKSYSRIFGEFEGLSPESIQGSGDVKYHLGARGSHLDPEGRELAVQVVANPSHLEAVDPVLEGQVRAKQELRGPQGHTKVLPLLIHGDAAFAGQGVVVETFNLSQLRGYRTGGTVHVVVNNQVGFTTAVRDARSSHYATDVAKTVQAPIIHVNGDDPEAVVRVARFAFEYRQTFNRDVVIDLICYRRRGHNEGDEPSYTQPVMYKLIEQRRSVRKLYMERLVNTGELSVEEGEALLEEYRGLLEEAFRETKEMVPAQFEPHPTAAPEVAPPPVSLEDIVEIARRGVDAAGRVHGASQAGAAAQERASMVDSGAIDWAMAEAFAIGSLAAEGHWVRLAGEDSQRGTFSHRHAALTDYETGEDWVPLQQCAQATPRVRIVDSLLSEFAAVGFEYGYSVEMPDALVMWEAQFGDFVNGAQVVIDQFITAGEDKWGQRSALVMLLPHGYEGQGPEHSSARMERFLQHVRREQPAGRGPIDLRLLLPRPAPPGSGRDPTTHGVVHPQVSAADPGVLQHPGGASPSGRFRKVVEDPRAAEPPGCTGWCCARARCIYDLERRRAELQLSGVAVLRLEQLYPFPDAELAEALAALPPRPQIWCGRRRSRPTWAPGRFLRDRLERVWPAGGPATPGGRRAPAPPRDRRPAPGGAGGAGGRRHQGLRVTRRAGAPSRRQYSAPGKSAMWRWTPPSLFAQLEPLDLAGRRPREFVDKLDQVRVLVPLQSRLAPLLKLVDQLLTPVVALGEDDRRLDPRDVIDVDRHHRRLRNRRVLHEPVLYLDGAHPQPADLHHVVDPALVHVVPVAVLVVAVARGEPASRQLVPAAPYLVPVGHQGAWAPNPKFARGTGRRRDALFLADLDLVAVDDEPGAARFDRTRPVRAVDVEHLCGAETVEDLDPGALMELVPDLGGQGLSRRHPESDR